MLIRSSRPLHRFFSSHSAPLSTIGRPRGLIGSSCIRHRHSLLLGSSLVAVGAIKLSCSNVKRSCQCEANEKTRLVHSKKQLASKRVPTKQHKSHWLQILSTRVKNTVFVIWRGVEIVVLFSPLIFILTPTAYIASYTSAIWRRIVDRTNASSILLTSGYIDEVEIHNSYNNETFPSNIAWRYTIFALQYLGPSFVKLGQWAATRRDLFPVHFCNRLSDLHSQTNTHDFSHTHKALVEAFGEDYESRGLIVTKDDTILGSGSVAQVYKGTLNCASKQGKPVAVKVLHPNIRVKVERDLALMQYIAEFIDRYIPLQTVKMLSLPRAVKNFADIMIRQVDLRIEGDNLQLFRENFGCSSTNSIPTVDFPEPQHDWISESVLVEDYIGDDAKPISHYLGFGDDVVGVKERKALAGTFVRSALKMVFVDNFVHSDLHPGNVFVREKRKSSNETKYQITFLDAGIATSLQQNDKKNLRDLFKAVVLNDGYTAGTLMVERARFERCTSIPGGKDKFALGVQELVSEFHDRRKRGLTLGAVKVGSLLARVLDLCRVYQVEIDPAMSSIVISMLVLEGLGRSLDPDLNLITTAMPFLVGKV